MLTADKTYYLNADKSKALPAKSVKEGEDETPEGAAFLLVRAGGPISEDDATKYGVKAGSTEEATAEQNIVVSGTASEGPAIVHVDEKAVNTAPENKAITAADGKATGRKTTGKSRK